MKRRTKLLTLLSTAAMVFLSLLITAQAQAAVFVADTLADSTTDSGCEAVGGNACTLREAILAANANAGADVINFAAGITGTITLTQSQLLITESVTINGPGARLLTVSGNNVSRIFEITGNGVVVNVSQLTIANGRAAAPPGDDTRGGGIFNHDGSTLNLNSLTIRNNSADLGGGIYTGRTTSTITNSTVNITNSTISNNTAHEGGGINNNTDGTLNIANSTISGNTATGSGGGIQNFNQLTLNNVTISNNTATNLGGGVFSTNVTPNVRNTIIAQNTAPLNPDVFGAFNSLGNNLIGIIGEATGLTNGVNGNIVGTTAAPINALLGSLQDNGGQTDTRALLVGSRAVDAGNNCVSTATCTTNNPFAALATDQRGLPRVVDGNGDGVATIDIGAFEVQQAPTAASVSIEGRVTTAKGRGISRAQITLTDAEGNTRLAMPNSFGYYRFLDVAAGETYILNIRSKSHQFAEPTRVITVTEDLVNVNFVAF